jgi:hypothetical protein
MEATLNVPWEQEPPSRRGALTTRSTTFDRWLTACGRLGRFDGAVRARMLVLFLATGASFAAAMIGGPAIAAYVGPITWALACAAGLVMMVGLLGFVGKVGRETGTRTWGTVAAVALLVSIAAHTGHALTRFVDGDATLLVGGRAVHAGWALLVAHLALGVALLAAVKILTGSARYLRAPVPLAHARSARVLLSIALGAVVGTHLVHLLGAPRVEVTAAAITVALTLSLVAMGRLAGAVRHVRDAIEDGLDAGQLGMPERWFARTAEAY